MKAQTRIRKALKNLYWRFRGRTIRNPKVPVNPSSFLFVCQGNICRGPFASGMAERLMEPKDPIRCGSAGLHVLRQSPSPREAVEAAGRFGVNLGEHLSRGIDIGMLETYDMILVMEAWQFRHMVRNFPAIRNKVFLLPLFDPGNRPDPDRDRALHIADPYGLQLDAYLRCYERITACLEGLLAEIRP